MSLNKALGLHGPQFPHRGKGPVSKLESTLHVSNYVNAISVPPYSGWGRCLTKVWGSGPPMRAASPAASGLPSGEGNSLRLQVLLRLEHREWEEVQAWERKGKQGGQQFWARASLSP